MAYGNRTPPALPEIDTAYPDYVIVFNYAKGATDWSQVHLFGSASAFRYDTGTGRVTTSESSHLRYIASFGDTEWLSVGVVAETPAITPGLEGNVYQRIWTNHDILDTSGNVWLAANTATPAELDRSFCLGVALSMMRRHIPRKGQTSTWKTIYEGEVQADKLVYESYESDVVSLAVGADDILVGSTMRLTLDGESRVYTVVAGGRYYAGNMYLIHPNYGEDDGFGLGFASGTGESAVFYLRDTAAHQIKVELFKEE